MKKFKFSLQSLLDLRAKKLEEKQIEFGELEYGMLKLQSELYKQENNLVRSEENLQNLLEAGASINVSLISSNQCHIAQKKIEIENQNKAIAEFQIKLDEKKQEMVEALKEKTMLEKLKEKKYKEFLKDIDMTERKELDEIGLVKYTR